MRTSEVDAAGFLWNKNWEESEETDIVDLQKQKERREKEKLYRWEITPAQMQRITEAALGHPRAIKNVKSVKTPPPKKVDSWKAEKAMQEMAEPIWKLGYVMDDLGEDDLGVLADLLQEKVKLDGTMAPVWSGLRDVCLRDREIKRLYRTGEANGGRRSRWSNGQRLATASPSTIGRRNARLGKPRPRRPERSRSRTHI